MLSSLVFSVAFAQSNALPSFVADGCASSGYLACPKASTPAGLRYWGPVVAPPADPAHQAMVVMTGSPAPLPSPSPVWGDAGWLAGRPPEINVPVPSSVCGLVGDPSPLYDAVARAYLHRATQVTRLLLPACTIYLDEGLILHANVQLIGDPASRTIFLANSSGAWTLPAMLLVSRAEVADPTAAMLTLRRPAAYSFSATSTGWVANEPFESLPEGVLIQDVVVDGAGLPSGVVSGVQIADGAHHVVVQDSEVVAAVRTGVLVETGARVELRRLAIHHNGQHGLGAIKLGSLWDTYTSRRFCSAYYLDKFGVGGLLYDPNVRTEPWTTAARHVAAQVNQVLDACAPQDLLIAGVLSYENGGMALDSHQNRGAVFGSYLVAAEGSAGYVMKLAESRYVQVFHNAIVGVEGTAVRSMAVDGQHRRAGGSVWHDNTFYVAHGANYIADFSGNERVRWCDTNSVDYAPNGAYAWDVKLYVEPILTRQSPWTQCFTSRFEWGGLETALSSGVPSPARRRVYGEVTAESLNLCPSRASVGAAPYSWFYASGAWTQTGTNSWVDLPVPGCP